MRYFASFEQELLNARKREIETENHMKQIGMYIIISVGLLFVIDLTL